MNARNTKLSKRGPDWTHDLPGVLFLFAFRNSLQSADSCLRQQHPIRHPDRCIDAFFPNREKVRKRSHDMHGVAA